MLGVTKIVKKPFGEVVEGDTLRFTETDVTGEPVSFDVKLWQQEDPPPRGQLSFKGHIVGTGDLVYVVYTSDKVVDVVETEETANIFDGQRNILA